MADAFLSTDDARISEEFEESLRYDPVSEGDQESAQESALDIAHIFDSRQETGEVDNFQDAGATVLEEKYHVIDQLQDMVQETQQTPDVDYTSVHEENSEPRASRLRIIEHTLVEIQKYIGTVIDLVREELGQEAEPQPLPKHEEIKEAVLSQDDFFHDNTFLTLEGEIPFCEEIEPEFLALIHEELLVIPEVKKEDEATVIHGVFRGEVMITGDGRDFPVPPNYASKSRLVEGDLLKLTMSETGALVYKQIGPVKRARVRGTLHYNPDTHGYTVVCVQQGFKVLTASVSYYKGIPGDEVIIIVPEKGGSTWAAIESILKK